MKTIATASHRDGDTLIIGEMPWPIRLVEEIVGWYNPRWGWDYRAWNRVLTWVSRHDRRLVSLPIGHSCAIAAKLWPGAGECWHATADAESGGGAA